VHREDRGERKGRNKWDSEDSVSEPAMVHKSDRRALEVPDHIDVWSFGGQRHGESCESSLPSESGAAHACAVEEVSDGFQSAPRGLKPDCIVPRIRRLNPRPALDISGQEEQFTKAA
jgi:hypothetical protein